MSLRRIATFIQMLAVFGAATAIHEKVRPRCTDLHVPVAVSTTVRNIPPGYNLTTSNFSTIPQLPATTLRGQYSIGASYCEPSKKVAHREHTMQIIVHGAFYTRTYWSGLEHPPRSINGTRYSYIDYASNEGYATLAIDRLCNGASSHPNGTLACQIESQVAVLLSLVQDTKAGRFGGRCFSQVILVGHSLGSSLVQAFSHIHPETVDSIVLTGYSDLLSNSVQSGNFGLPASQTTPEKFGGLGQYYFTFSNETIFAQAFFYGAFDPAVARYNYEHRGTFDGFEIATDAIGQMKVPGYKGKVIAVNGLHDEPICQGNCGTGENSHTARVREFYPNARSFRYANINNTGHCINLHYTAQEAYRTIFDFLAEEEDC